MRAARRQPPRARVLRDALRRPRSFGPISLPVTLGLASGFAASLAVDAALIGSVASPLRQVIDTAAFAVVAGVVWIATQPRRVRDAHDVLTWLNGWETERWSREVGRRLPFLPRSRPEILEELPDTMGLRPLRVELLAARGEHSAARERLEQLPTDTPWQRFERAALEEWVGWWADEPERLEQMRSRADEIEDQERRVVARAMLAAAQARRAASSGGDAVAPLAAVKDELGGRLGRYAFGYRTGIVLVVVAMGTVTAAAVVIAAAILR